MNLKKRDVKLINHSTQINISLRDHMATLYGEENRTLASEEIIYPPTRVSDDGEIEGAYSFRFFYPVENLSPEDSLNEINHDTTFNGTRAALYQNEFHILDVPIDKNDIILDFGSNLGVFSIVIGKLFPQTTIHAFDANPRVCKLVKMNTVLNGVLNVNIHNLAIGEEELDEVSFWTENDYNTCAIKKEDDAHPKSIGKVRQTTLESLLNSPLLNIDKVKYAKFDIETAEIPVFNKIFEETPELLEKIEYLNLEVHGQSEEANQVREKCKDYYGDKLFLY